MTVQPAEAPSTTSPHDEIALLPFREHDDTLIEPGLAPLADVIVLKTRTPVPPRHERTLSERVDREAFDRAREEITARTEYCRACAGSYVLDATWADATPRQREAWTEMNARRQGGDGLCTHCEAAALTVIASGIDGYRADIFAAIRSDSTSRAVAPASRFDASGGTESLTASASPRDTYEHMIEEDPRAAAEAAYADVFSGLAVAPGPWSRHGICGEAETEGINYFASRVREIAPAKQRCLSCPVLAECLDYALRTPDGAAVGVWGGLSRKERTAIRSTARHDAYAAIGLEVGAYGMPLPVPAP